MINYLFIILAGIPWAKQPITRTVYDIPADYKSNELFIHNFEDKEKPEQVELVIKTTIQLASEVLGLSPNAIKNKLREAHLHIFIHKQSDDGFKCYVSGKYEQCSGLFNAKTRRIDYAKRECIADSELAFELLEAIVHYTNNKKHHNYAYLFYWPCDTIKDDTIKNKCLKQNAEQIITNTIKQSVCGE